MLIPLKSWGDRLEVLRRNEIKREFLSSKTLSSFLYTKALLNKKK